MVVPRFLEKEIDRAIHEEADSFLLRDRLLRVLRRVEEVVDHTARGQVLVSKPRRIRPSPERCGLCGKESYGIAWCCLCSRKVCSDCTVSGICIRCASLNGGARGMRLLLESLEQTSRLVPFFIIILAFPLILMLDNPLGPLLVVLWSVAPFLYAMGRQKGGVHSPTYQLT